MDPTPATAHGAAVPPAPASTSPNVPALLHRAPSQQDIELARHLQSFQSQGTNKKDQSPVAEDARLGPANGHDAETPSRASGHDGAGDDLQRQSPAHAQSPGIQPTSAPLQRADSIGASPSGQMCR